MHDDDESRRRIADVKTLRMCRQAAEALCLAVAACDDDLIQSLRVESVDPGPDGSTLWVTVDVPPDLSPALALARLEEAKGLLRSEIARAISRKRVPSLLFRLQRPE